MLARESQIAFQSAGVTEQGLRSYALEIFMRRSNGGRATINYLHGQFARRRNLCLNPLDIFARVELSLDERVKVIPHKLYKGRARLIEFFDRKLLQVRLDLYAFLFECLHPLFKVEMLGPAIETAPHQPRALDNL